MKLKIRDLELDSDSWEVTLNKQPIHLSFKEFKLLKRLMEKENFVVNQNQILCEWEEDDKEYSLKSNIVVVYISYLKKKIPGYIHSVRKAGYKIK